VQSFLDYAVQKKAQRGPATGGPKAIRDGPSLRSCFSQKVGFQNEHLWRKDLKSLCFQLLQETGVGRGIVLGTSNKIPLRVKSKKVATLRIRNGIRAGTAAR
jgi:hypothetical protein